MATEKSVKDPAALSERNDNAQRPDSHLFSTAVLSSPKMKQILTQHETHLKQNKKQLPETKMKLG